MLENSVTIDVNLESKWLVPPYRWSSTIAGGAILEFTPKLVFAATKALFSFDKETNCWIMLLQTAQFLILKLRSIFALL